eukprot:TRINITY_DN1955_c0_g3_i2.p1 TRINITY_DN1955_c0_g3~~TRINITY_DN1955_c0_g3_i2.p1  ORF type:complete len:551 (-),score=167.17 TRINITY_DN1955_c0_g3_i2:23-1675(-)
MTKLLHELAKPVTTFIPLLSIPIVQGLDVLKSLAVLQQMTRVKMSKIIKLLEHDVTRKLNLLTGDVREIIRDIQAFQTLLIKHDFYGMVKKAESTWQIGEAFSETLFSSTVKAEQAYKTADADIEAEKCFTLNWQVDPDDKLLKHLMRVKEKSKKKDDEPTGKEGKASSQISKADEDAPAETEEEKDRLIPVKLLNPVGLSLRLLADILPLLRGQHNKLKELRSSDKFRRFALKTARLQKVDISGLNMNEKKAFWINIFHLQYLHTYILLGAPTTDFHRTSYFSVFQYKVGNYSYSLQDIRELARLHGTGDDKYRYFEKVDPRRNFGITPLDGRILFAMSYFCASSPKFRPYYAESIEEDLDTQLEDVVENHVMGDMFGDTCSLKVPALFDWFSEDLKVYVHKKYKQSDSEWIKPLLNHDISGGVGPKQLKNEYKALQQLKKSKPQIVFVPWDWSAKFQAHTSDIEVKAPPDEEVEEEDEAEKKQGGKVKVKYDKNNFPTVPWPETKLEDLTKDELLDYIRVCKRSLKQGQAMYDELTQKMDSLGGGALV